jgi:L-aspartate oxidase
MDGYPQKELSPRDVVSKEIFKQIQKTDSSHVYLDVRHLDCNKLRTQFPNLISKIEACGIDIEEEAIPVAPAAHYCIGGIATDLDGRTSVEGLYACGEVAATKVHGANRLASNSLLECLVFSKRSVNHAKNYRNDLSIREDDAIANFKIDDSGQSSFLNVRQKVAEILTTHVGIERNESGLTKALNELSSILSSSDREYYKLRTHSMLKIVKAITNSALQRRESRGVHLRTDFPDTDKKLVARRDTEQNPILTDG